MKKIELNGISWIEPIRGGTSQWYWATDYTSGDLYEAQELFSDGHRVKCNSLYLISYPDGKVYQPIAPADGRYFGNPIYDMGYIAILMVDFPAGKVHILRFDPSSEELSETAQLPLSQIKDCYGLMLHTAPLMLTRQPNDNTFEILWPEHVSFPVGDTETFNFCDGEKLYFNIWFEDPEYREETVVRSITDGSILEKFSGDILIMPNGEKWNIK